MLVMGSAAGVIRDRWTQRLQRVGGCLLDAWLPATCIVCGGSGDGALCAACEAALPGYAVARCPCCGLLAPATSTVTSAATPTATRCAGCEADPPPFGHTVVLADYAPPLDRVVHALKFGRDAALARPLGRALARCLARTIAGHDGGAAVLTAIPLSLPRLAARGFNQSLEIARAIAGAQRLRLDHRLLQRTRAGAPAATMHAQQRRLALAGAFVAPRRLDGCTVIVVDDVMTTGATLRAAGAALAGAGAAHVINCVVARTAHPD